MPPRRKRAARLRRVDLAGLLDAGLTFLAAFTIGLYAVRSLCGPELVPMRCSLPPTCSSALLNARTRRAVAGQLNSSRALDLATVEAYRNREEPRWPEARSKTTRLRTLARRLRDQYGKPGGRAMNYSLIRSPTLRPCHTS